jgi:16S rRNA (uracil1498-N3)-methyltransferase
MARLSVFIDSECRREGEDLLLSNRESYHLCRVLRARSGDLFTAFDGFGTRFSTRVIATDSHHARLHIQDTAYQARPQPELTLILGLPKGKTVDAIMKGAVELGVSRICPVLTRHVEGRPTDKQEKWSLVLQEAVKQSHNPWIPELCPLRSLSEVLSEGDLPVQAGFVASLQSRSIPLVQALGALEGATRVYLAVGPEGDFAPDEYELFESSGFIPVSLGPTILRTETAALSMGAVSAALLRKPVSSSDG